ncbi:MAG TPA: L,D-transpeptidase [Acidimicrobiales bacterium]
MTRSDCTARANGRSTQRMRRLLFAALAATVAVTGCGFDDGEGAAESARGVAAADVASAALRTPPADPTTVPPPLDPWQVLVAVAKPHVSELTTFDAPGGNEVSFELPLTNPWYFGGELALLVEEGRETDDWLRVALPVRPNGTTAWIRRDDVDIRTHRVHAQVVLSERRLRVWDGETLLADAPVVIGAPSTPTPVGRFFVNARIRRDNPAGAYGPWILSLSGYSEALESFDGGLPVIAIHGTNRPDLVGTARSNGCIRVTNDVIEQLAQVVPLGTPVEIVA